MPRPDHPYVFHMVQATLWDSAVASGETYFPPTYDADGFTHATSNPAKLLNVANHFYPDVAGEWYCLKMTVESLAATGVKTVFEGTAPVGDIQPDFEGADDELFPHILGGIAPAAVLDVYPIVRSPTGAFLEIPGVTDSAAEIAANVTPTALSDMPDETVVLDVRTAQEYAAGHIPDAVNINVNDEDFVNRLAELDPSKTYVVHCALNVPNGRAARAMSLMRQSGFNKLSGLQGGYEAWAAADVEAVEK